MQSFPNPCNPSTTISFTLASGCFVSLKVYDILGKEISTLVSREMPAGNFTEQWNGADAPSGIYFYRFQAGAFNETKKIILSK
ncbi:MAG: T9SS type A sorting domain-containing protein [Bacteroidota bacterium]